MPVVIMILAFIGEGAVAHAVLIAPSAVVMGTAAAVTDDTGGK